MLQFAEINPHLALAQSESFQSAGDREWARFVYRAERLLGHGIDGNEQTDGFSIDLAYAMFEAGDTVADFVVEARANKADLAAAFGPLLSYPPVGRRL